MYSGLYRPGGLLLLFWEMGCSRKRIPGKMASIPAWTGLHMTLFEITLNVSADSYHSAESHSRMFCQENTVYPGTGSDGDATKMVLGCPQMAPEQSGFEPMSYEGVEKAVLAGGDVGLLNVLDNPDIEATVFLPPEHRVQSLLGAPPRFLACVLQRQGCQKGANACSGAVASL